MKEIKKTKRLGALDKLHHSIRRAQNWRTLRKSVATSHYNSVVLSRKRKSFKPKLGNNELASFREEGYYTAPPKFDVQTESGRGGCCDAGPFVGVVVAPQWSLTLSGFASSAPPLLPPPPSSHSRRPRLNSPPVSLKAGSWRGSLALLAAVDAAAVGRRWPTPTSAGARRDPLCCVCASTGDDALRMFCAWYLSLLVSSPSRILSPTSFAYPSFEVATRTL